MRESHKSKAGYSSVAPYTYKNQELISSRLSIFLEQHVIGMIAFGMIPYLPCGWSVSVTGISSTVCRAGHHHSAPDNLSIRSFANVKMPWTFFLANICYRYRTQFLVGIFAYTKGPFRPEACGACDASVFFK